MNLQRHVNESFWLTLEEESLSWDTVVSVDCTEWKVEHQSTNDAQGWEKRHGSESRFVLAWKSCTVQLCHQNTQSETEHGPRSQSRCCCCYTEVSTLSWTCVTLAQAIFDFRRSLEAVHSYVCLRRLGERNSVGSVQFEVGVPCRNYLCRC